MTYGSYAMSALVMALNLSVPAAPSQSPQVTPYNSAALMCFYERDEVAGMSKICYYNCGGSTVAITVSVTTLCRLNISR